MTTRFSAALGFMVMIGAAGAAALAAQQAARGCRTMAFGTCCAGMGGW